MKSLLTIISALSVFSAACVIAVTPAAITATPTKTATLWVVPAATEVVETPHKFIGTTLGYVNLRSCASQSCDVLAVLPPNTPVIADICNGGWCYDAKLGGWVWSGCFMGGECRNVP